MKRVGLVGYGYIGKAIYQRILENSENTEPAFVYTRDVNSLVDVDECHVIERLEEAGSRDPDLIVEMAHPSITLAHGPKFLSFADYMPLSVTALAMDNVLTRIKDTAEAYGHQLYLPVGALVGGNSLWMSRETWKEVKIMFLKNPANIEFSESGMSAPEDDGQTTVYEGPVRGIAKMFPRNVNSMVTCALMSAGLDKTQAILISDPSIDYGEATVEAWADNDGYLKTVKRQPMAGVSGEEMIDSTWQSILKALNHDETPSLV